VKRRLPAAALLVAWLAVGLWGVQSYASHYYTYRGFSPPRDPPGVPRGRTVDVRMYSPALRRERSYLIYLPPGYERLSKLGKRLPVLYLLHGTPGFPALFLNAGHLGVAVDKLVDARAIRPMLVVMPDGRNGGFLSDTEWANTHEGRWEDYVMEVVHAVDARWPTIRSRSARAIGGDSEGGYAAMNIAFHHLDTFATVEAWSGYFKAHQAGPFAHATEAELVHNSPSEYVWDYVLRLARNPLHAFLYAGRSDRGRLGVATFAQELRAVGVRVRFALYPGRHEWRLWRDQTPRMLRYADSRFHPPARHRPGSTAGPGRHRHPRARGLRVRSA
jgi:enterochelin esterase-like enzyme